MFGVNLIHAGFLAAALSVSVPILIHLLMRPRARSVPIGTLRFLKLALKQTTRRRKIRRWLLLALRAAAVLLLTLLFARPYLASFGVVGQDREVVVLVDQSGSMAAMYSGRTLFACAQAAAEKIIADLPQGTKVHLAYFDDRGAMPCADTVSSSNRSRKQLRMATPKHILSSPARPRATAMPRPPANCAAKGSRISPSGRAVSMARQAAVISAVSLTCAISWVPDCMGD